MNARTRSITAAAALAAASGCHRRRLRSHLDLPGGGPRQADRPGHGGGDRRRRPRVALVIRDGGNTAVSPTAWARSPRTPR